MRLDPLLQHDLEIAEGRELEAYPDIRGWWTIGVGHKLPVRAGGWKGLVWTDAQVDKQLVTDMQEALRSVDTLGEWVAVSDNRARRNAVIELVFNMGFTKWRTFTKTRGLLTVKKFSASAAELLDSDWSHQVGKTRSDRLADYLKLGSYPPSAVASSSSASWSSAWPPGYVLEDSSPAATGSQL